MGGGQNFGGQDYGNFQSRARSPEDARGRFRGRGRSGYGRGHTTQSREVHSHIHWALDTYRCFLCTRLGPYAHLPPLMRTSKSTLDLEVNHAVACVRIA